MKKLTKIFTLFLSLLFSTSLLAHTVVVIDAGHGGKDPGAIGKTLGLKEKTVTLAISKELRKLLNADPNFKAVMTRNSDIFIPLPNRTEIARKNKANYLVSIHADSSPKSSVLKGASVWVLSNRRASDEMGKWLEESEKQSELLGGAGSILSNTNERYLNQTVLDLQFSHSQRAGLELGRSVLSKMSNVMSLAKSSPQHASLSVLRSPDITSILVETGFLSNPVEEQKLANPTYRKQVARAIYHGLVAYHKQNLSLSEPKEQAPVKESKNEERKTAKKETKSEKEAKTNNKEKENKKSATKSDEKKDKKAEDKKSAKVVQVGKKEIKVSNNGYHVVAKDETLYSIARAYDTTPEKLSKLNGIKNNQIAVGKKLKVK